MREKKADGCIAISREGLGLQSDDFGLVVPESKLYFLLPSRGFFKCGNLVRCESSALVLEGGDGGTGEGLEVAGRCGG